MAPGSAGKEWFLALLCVLLTTQASRIYRDPELLSRLPQSTRDAIDHLIHEKLERVKRAVFEKFPDDRVFGVKSTQVDPEPSRLSRTRRQAPTNSSQAVYGDWSTFSECSVKCGGGVQVRTRTCLQGNCSQIGPYLESRECGTLPCLAGTYVLSSVTAIGLFDASTAKRVKLLRVDDNDFLCYITDTRLTVLKWNMGTLTFSSLQVLTTDGGVDVDIIRAYPSTYLVVLEKAWTVFAGGFYSRIYYYDPWSGMFDTSTPVLFKVEEPTALDTFHVFGEPFLAIVNYRTTTDVTPCDITERACDGETITINCGVGGTIVIKSVFYGREDSSTCRTNFNSIFARSYSGLCSVRGVTQIVASKCNNQRSCSVTSSPSVFTHGTCPNLIKYLRVSYRCQDVSYTGTPAFYRWDGIGLLSVPGESLVTFGAVDVESFSIHTVQLLAVANHINDAQIHHIDSEVYTFSLSRQRFESLQKIRTDGALDLEFFKIGSQLSTEYFLAVANHVKVMPDGSKRYDIESVIYKWNWNVFVPFQCIKTYGALKWTAITGDNGEFTLVVNNKYGNATFYSYDGWRFYETNAQPTPGSIIHASDSIAFYQMNGQSFFLAKNRWSLNGTKNFFKASYAQTFPQYELLESTVVTLQQLNRSVQGELLPAMSSIRAIFNNDTKDNFMYSDHNYSFAGVRRFKNIVVLTNWTTETAKINKTILSAADNAMIDRLQWIEQRINNSNVSQAMDMNATYVGALTKDTDQSIACNFNFSRSITIADFSLGDATVTGTIGNVNLTEALANALFVDQNASVPGYLQFNSSVSFEEDLRVYNGIDGVDPGSLIRIDDERTIAGKKTFQQADFISLDDSVKTLRVLGLVNGVNLTNAITLNTDQNLTGHVTFTRPIFMEKDLVMSGTLNGLDISNIVNDSIVLNSDNISISVSKAFSSLEIQSNLELPTGVKVGPLDLSEFNSSVLRKSSDEELLSRVTFLSNVIFHDGIHVGGNLSGVPIDDVLRLNESAVITGLKTFLQDLHLEDRLDLQGTLNGVNISDIMDIQSDQTVVGSISFVSSVLVDGNVTSEGLIGGVNISDAFRNTLTLRDEQVITGNKTFSSLYANRVRVGGCSFDCELLATIKNLHNSSVKADSSTKIYGTTTFRKALTIEGNLNVTTTINNISLSQDLALQGVDQEIRGNKTFNYDVEALSNVTLESSVNGVRIDDLYRTAWRKSQNSNIYGLKSFRGDTLLLQSLNIDTQSINGFNLQEDLAMLGKFGQVVTGKKSFTSPVSIYNMSVDSMTVAGLVDGVNLTELDKDLLKVDGYQTITGDKFFSSDVTFFGDSIITGLINGVNITELYASSLRLDKDQNVTGRKTFKRQVRVLRSLEVDGLVDGVNITDINLHLDKFNQSTFLNTTTIYGDAVVLGNVSVDGLINNKNLSSIVQDTLVEIGDQTVSGAFNVSELIVYGNVDIADFVNGMDFASEVILTHRTEVITGTKTFSDGLHVQKNLTVTGLVNGINLTWLAENVAYKNKDNYFTGNITLATSLVLNQSLLVGGLISGLNITDLPKSTLMKHGNQTISSPLNFADAVFASNLTIASLLNGQNLTTLSQSVVYKCFGENKDIYGPKTFSSLNVQGTVETGNASIVGLINEIDLQGFSSNAVKRFGNFTISGAKRMQGNLTLNGDLVVDNRINGLVVPGDLVTLTGDEEIIGHKVLDADTFLENDFMLPPGTRLGLVDLSEFAKAVVLANQSANISGPVRFQRDVQVTEGMFAKIINNVSLNDLMQRSGNQTILGDKQVANVDVWGNVTTSGAISGFDMRQLYEDTLMTGRNNTLTGRKVIAGLVYMLGNLDVGLVDGVNVTELFKGYSDLARLTEGDLVRFNATLLEHKQAITTLAQAIRNIRQRLDYFVTDQELDIPYVAKSFDVQSINLTQLLVVAALRSADGVVCTNSTVYVQQANQRFEEHSKIMTNGVTGVKMATVRSETFLFTATGVENRGCYPDIPLDEMSAAFRLDSATQRFEREIRYTSRTNRAVDVQVYNENNRNFIVHTSAGNRTNMDKCSLQNINSVDSTGLKEVASFVSCESLKTVMLATSDNFTIVATLGADIAGQKQVSIYYVWTNGSIYLAQVILTHTASDLHAFDLGKDGQFLAVANTYESSSIALEISYAVPVSVYKLELLRNQWRFSLYQDLNVAASVKLASFSVGSYYYLAAATYNQQVVIFQHLGALKFAQKLVIPVQGFNSIQDMRAWWHLDSLYLGLLVSNSLDSTYPFTLRIAKAKFNADVDASAIASQILDQIV